MKGQDARARSTFQHFYQPIRFFASSILCSRDSIEGDRWELCGGKLCGGKISCRWSG